MHMDQNTATPPAEKATEPATLQQHQLLNAHERQVILQYRSATEVTRARVRRLLDPPIND